MTQTPPKTASVSQIVRIQLMQLGIPFDRVQTRRLSSGNYATRVYGYDVPSIAEALRTLNPEVVAVEETVTFANLISNGRI